MPTSHYSPPTFSFHLLLLISLFSFLVSFLSLLSAFSTLFFLSEQSRAFRFDGRIEASRQWRDAGAVNSVSTPSTQENGAGSFTCLHNFTCHTPTTNLSKPASHWNGYSLKYEPSSGCFGVLFVAISFTTGTVRRYSSNRSLHMPWF